VVCPRLGVKPLSLSRVVAKRDMFLDIGLLLPQTSWGKSRSRKSYSSKKLRFHAIFFWFTQAKQLSCSFYCHINECNM